MSREQTIWHDGFAHLGFPAALTQQTGWKIYVNGQPTSRGRHLASHDAVTLEYGSPDPPPDVLSVFPPNLPR